jgi:hypothetical protein
MFPYGDLGPFTYYTSKKRKVIRFLRSPPTSPPSAMQIRQRQKWTAAAATWTTQRESDRDWWRQLARINHLKITAYNAFIIYHTIEDRTWFATLKKP